MAMPRRMNQNAGFTMIEVLVTLVILLVGLLGLAGLQGRAHQAELESYQRAQALLLMSDMVDRINTNRKAALCYAVTTNTSTGSPALGTGYSGTPTCTAAVGTTATRTMADKDLQEWNNLLQGAAETAGGTSVGSMIGARGCVSFDSVANLYRVSVAWQGLGTTVDPTTVDAAFTCGKDQYGNEAMRRIVSTTFAIADLD